MAQGSQNLYELFCKIRYRANFLWMIGAGSYTTAHCERMGHFEKMQIKKTINSHSGKYDWLVTGCHGYGQKCPPQQISHSRPIKHNFSLPICVCHFSDSIFLNKVNSSVCIELFIIGQSLQCIRCQFALHSRQRQQPWLQIICCVHCAVSFKWLVLTRSFSSFMCILSLLHIAIAPAPKTNFVASVSQRQRANL